MKAVSLDSIRRKMERRRKKSIPMKEHEIQSRIISSSVSDEDTAHDIISDRSLWVESLYRPFYRTRETMYRKSMKAASTDSETMTTNESELFNEPGCCY